MMSRFSLRVYLLLSHLALVVLMLAAVFLLLAWRASLAEASSLPVAGPSAGTASQPVNSQNQLGMALFFGSFTIGGLVLGEYLSARWIRPLSSASALAEKVANGDYSQRIQPSGPREMAELANNLNRMAEVLRSQLKSRQLVLANVTHELARPIGALRLGIDSLQSGALKDPALTEDLLTEMSRTLMRMEALVDDLSLAARPITQPIAVDRKCFSIEPFLYGLRSRFWSRAEGRGIDLQLSIQSRLPPILVDELRLNQMVTNLVENSLKYSCTGDFVRISAELEGQMMKITVRDSGPGIPEQEMLHITEPFFQGKSVKGINQGMGLGLSIVRQLVEAHQGRLEFRNHPEGGLVVSLYLPICPLTGD